MSTVYKKAREKLKQELSREPQRKEECRGPSGTSWPPGLPSNSAGPGVRGWGVADLLRVPSASPLRREPVAEQPLASPPQSGIPQSCTGGHKDGRSQPGGLRLGQTLERGRVPAFGSNGGPLHCSWKSSQCSWKLSVKNPQD